MVFTCKWNGAKTSYTYTEVDLLGSIHTYHLALNSKIDKLQSDRLIKMPAKLLDWSLYTVIEWQSVHILQ